MADDGSSERTSAALLQSMALLATLSTAADVNQAMKERRAGHDPAAQETPGRARAGLQAACETLMEVLMQLLMGPVSHDAEAPPTHADAVRHFDCLMKLRRAERLTHAVHQRLLSLYPDVSEALVEEARVVEQQLTALRAEDADATVSFGAAIERAIGLVVWARHEVA